MVVESSRFRVVTIIEERLGIGAVNAVELWDHRELLLFLIWRDVKVRYKQTVLGAAWAILQPTLTMVIFTVFFGHLAGIDSQGVPYPLFSYTALLPWTFFAMGATQSSNSVVGAANLIRKVYFPRLVIPLGAVLAGVVDLVLAFVVLLLMMAWYGLWPGVEAVLLPAVVMLAVATAFGVGTWLAALNVAYRDVRYVVPFLVQLWLFVTPVIYPVEMVTARLSAMGIPPWLFGLNPMTGVVEGFRWSLLGVGSPPWSLLFASTGVAGVVVVSGVVYFQHVESTFADIV